MGSAVDLTIKSPDARILVLQTESKVGAIEHNSSIEKCFYEWVVFVESYIWKKQGVS